jgi:DNA-binding helix-hairpin-helix protein with protein kinase domain
VPARRLHDDHGRPLDLGPQIASGGEGAVFGVVGRPDVVAKLYHDRPDERQTAKLAWLVRHAAPELCKFAGWPVGTLSAAPGGPVAGFLMPRFSGYRPIHTLYSPAHRRTQFPRADWSFLVHTARNCAAAFDAVHARGIVVGDVNQSNVLVSEQALVCLIDCDSFQVTDGDAVFPCEVGVGPFTPPELQGQSFRDVVRTVDHDRFGLAVLVFHLLFMGRHPFAGRYLGPGEMPLEQAIREGRFAYSRSAGQLQMTPPPHAPPLSAVPADLGELFERALLRGGERRRPAAAEWEAALGAFLAAMRTCLADPGHKLPAERVECPWCVIVNDGGPNFFLGVGVGSTVFAADAAVLVKAWDRIEAVPRRTFALTVPVVTARPSTQLAAQPPWLTRVLRLADVGVALLLGLTLLAVCFDWRPAVVCGSLAAVLFALGRVLRRSGQGERTRRRQVLEQRLAELNGAVAEWHRLADRYSSAFYGTKNRLKEVLWLGQELQARYDAERHRMEHNKESYFRDQFLRTKFLTEASIPGIAGGRKVLLASYGIETAYDIDEERLAEVRGIGPVFTLKLLDWRRKVAREFVFDPAATVPEPEVRAMVLKYRQMEEGYRGQLQRGALELETLGEVTAGRLDALQERIKELTVLAAQAEADVKALGERR